MVYFTVLQFLNEVPVLAVALILANSCAFLCCLFVFAVIWSTQLHANCRFLFSVWSLAFLFLLASQIALSLTSFFSAHGYLAESIVDPPARSFALRSAAAAVYVATSMEVLIGVERAVSASNPQRYYDQSLFAKHTILPLLAITIFLAALIAFVALGASFVLCAIIFFHLDLLALTANTVAVRYCRKKELESFGIGSLNARYQVKESADMASAMQPALLIAFLLKSTGVIVFLTICIGRASDGCASNLLSLNWGIIEALCLINSLTSGVILNIQLVRKHPRLRRNADKLLSRIWRPRYAVSTLVNIPPKNSEEKLHFDGLKRVWE